MRGRCLSQEDRRGARKLEDTYFRPSVRRNLEHQNETDYLDALRKRQIWCEGTFAAQNTRLTTRLRGSGGPLPLIRNRFEPQKNNKGYGLTPEGVFFLASHTPGGHKRALCQQLQVGPKFPFSVGQQDKCTLLQGTLPYIHKVVF